MYVCSKILLYSVIQSILLVHLCTSCTYVNTPILSILYAEFYTEGGGPRDISPDLLPPPKIFPFSTVTYMCINSVVENCVGKKVIYEMAQ